MSIAQLPEATYQVSSIYNYKSAKYAILIILHKNNMGAEYAGLLPREPSAKNLIFVEILIDHNQMKPLYQVLSVYIHK